MQCLEPDVVLALVDGELSSKQRSETALHISQCDACRVVVAEAARDVEQSSNPSPDGTTLLAVGDRIGRYEIVSLQGRGAMGLVYAARDPELHREVAIKVVAIAGAEDPAAASARLLREARALAVLSHPNVVSIYDVGREGDAVYLAMELIDGVTLTTWLARSTRAPDEIIDTFVCAGRGLAAAHRSGLVHRDFKPDNVLVDSMGAVKVVDFGLVRPDGTRAPSADPDVPSHEFTLTGVAIGTPAYMAPEQHRGERVDARSDQFSFCVALYRAIFGQVPFGGANSAELLASMGSAPEIPREPRLSSRRRAAIQRGLSVSAENRFATLDELLAELRAPRRSLVGPVVLGTLGVVAIVAVSQLLWAPEPPCTGGPALAATIWPPQVAARFAGGASDGATTRFATMIEAIAADWRSVHDRVCRATRVEGHQTEAELERRMACLEGLRGRATSIVTYVREPSGGPTLDAAIVAAARLPTPKSCLRVDSGIVMPSDAERRARLIELQTRLAQAETIAAVEDLDRRAEVDALLADTKQFGEPKTIVRAALAAASLERSAGQLSKAASTIRGAVEVAARGGLDRELAGGWSHLSIVLSDQSRYDAAIEVGRASLAATARAGGDARLESVALMAIGIAQSWELDYPSAVHSLEEAVRAAEAGGPSTRLELATSLLELALLMVERRRQDGDPLAVRAAERGLDVMRATVGPSHPKSHDAEFVLGMALSTPGHFDEALALMKRALDTQLPNRRRHPVQIYYYDEYATTLRLAGRCEDALSTLQRARTIALEELGEGDPKHVMVERNMAICERTLGHLDRARTRLLWVLAATEADRGRHHPSAARAHLELAEVDIAAGRHKAATKRLEQMVPWLRTPRDQELIDRARSLLARIE